MAVEIREEAFDPWQELANFQRGMSGVNGKYGATSIFVGTMRDFNEGDEVRGMFLEHYPQMTEKHLEMIAVEASRRWELLDVLIIHRVGEIQPNDPIVLVAAWTAHRAAAFDAARYLIEELKTRAPFWKKESLPERKRWVAKNTPAD
ncbi:MAG TPA: molybdenum cofactor biosynthesis protein MoaE [Gammaproteobacteria bacterium]|nr:molybdenum cofactor biosynthesis protein MoaE [Gammaproteobacteria bacterium]